MLEVILEVRPALNSALVASVLGRDINLLICADSLHEPTSCGLEPH